MAQESGFFNAVQSGGTYDRTYNAADFADYFSSFIGNGVFLNANSDGLQVVAKTGLTVTVKAGRAFIDGYYYHLTENMDVTLQANNTSSAVNRMIVCELNLTDRQITVKARDGQQTPINNGTIHELVLAVVNVGAGVSSISNSVISDMRPNKTYCGFVEAVVENVDFTSLYNQMQTSFNEWFDEVKDQLTTDVAGNLQSQIDALESQINSQVSTLQGQIANVKTSFYRVGDIIMTTIASNPSSVYGGTWVAWGAGRVPVGYNSSDSDFNSVEKTGGSKTQNYAHSHTVNSHSHLVPSHTHSLNNNSACALIGRTVQSLTTISYKNGGSRGGLTYDRRLTFVGGSAGQGLGVQGVSDTSEDVTSLTGNTNSTSVTTQSSSPGTNSQLGSKSVVQPYITCYFWKRTA